MSAVSLGSLLETGGWRPPACCPSRWVIVMVVLIAPAQDSCEHEESPQALHHQFLRLNPDPPYGALGRGSHCSIESATACKRPHAQSALYFVNILPWNKKNDESATAIL